MANVFAGIEATVQVSSIRFLEMGFLRGITMSQYISTAQSRILMAVLGAASIAALSAVGAERAAIPDFSGMWGRNAFNFEPMPSGPRLLANLRRLPNGVGDPNKLVGDYNKSDPEAASRRNREAERRAFDRR